MTNADPVHDATASTAPAEAPLLKLEDFLPHRLNVLSSLVSQALTRVYGRHGIGIPEWRGLGCPREDGVRSRAAGGAPNPHPTTPKSCLQLHVPARTILSPRPPHPPRRRSGLASDPRG